MSAFCFQFIIVCPAGHFLNPMKNDLCEECPVGSWNNRTDQAACTSCPGGGSTPGNGTVLQDQCGKSVAGGREDLPGERDHLTGPVR